MPTISNVGGEVPLRHEIYLDENAKRLSAFLRVRCPGEKNDIPGLEAQLDRDSIFMTFTRSQKLEPKWENLFLNATPAGLALAYTRNYFERSWKMEKYDSAIIGRYSAKVTLPNQVQFTTESGVQDFAVYVPSGFDSTSGSHTWQIAAAAPNQTVFLHRPSDRLYLARSSQPLDLTTEAGYNFAWESQIIEVIHVIGVVAGEIEVDVANRTLSSAECIDLSPAVIMQQSKEFDIQRRITDSMQIDPKVFFQADELPKLGLEEIDRRVALLTDLLSRRDNVGIAIERLKDRASDLGYRLFTSKEELDSFKAQTPGANQKLVWRDGGVLALGYRDLFHWTTKARRKIDYAFYTHVYYETIHHYKLFMNYAEVSVDYDPWVEKENDLQVNKNFTTYIFQLSDDGYQTAAGISLQSVMDRCDVDERFRCKCAIFLPVYEQKLSVGSILTKYIVITAPLPGFVAFQPPTIYAEQRMSYRSAWTGVEVGPLLNTISLAPGEKRKVNVTTRTSVQRELSTVANSLLDINESASTDLATEIENESRRERESSSSTSWNVQASGGIGVFSASAGASGNSNKKTSDFARDVQKVARKASQSYSRRVKQEVSTTNSVKTSSEYSESMSYEIENINQGRTLNLLFFSLNNSYDGGIYLDDLRLVVNSPREIVAGTGISTFRTYSIENIKGVVDEISNYWIPPELGGKPKDVWIAEVKVEIFRAITEHLNELAGLGLIVFKGRDGTPLAQVKIGALGAGGATLGSLIDSALIELSAYILGREFQDILLEPHRLTIPSSGVYLEAFIGANPGTEPYSEEMRKQEIRQKAAEVLLEQGRAAYYFSLAGIQLPPPAPDHPIPHPPSPNQISGLSLESDKSIKILLDFPLSKGTWELFYNNVRRFELFNLHAGETTIKIDFAVAQDWIAGASKKDIELRDLESTQIISG